ncbi:cardiac phospholamban isoform X1 [Hylobates moloch]|uniref:cardiac phospholamban isoform X1 n=2 Tax=Hylobates moloch TaxID=81572 RepID=UPI0026758842|nr:cardiac phospholamban isoform X1 [Hylobates moloch]
MTQDRNSHLDKESKSIREGISEGTHIYRKKRPLSSSMLPKRRQLSHIWLPAFYLSLDHLKLQTSSPAGIMEKVQHLTRSAIRRASTIEMPQQARQNLQNLFINFCLILICLLLICIIVMLL